MMMTLLPLVTVDEWLESSLVGEFIATVLAVLTVAIWRLVNKYLPAAQGGDTPLPTTTPGKALVVEVAASEPVEDEGGSEEPGHNTVATHPVDRDTPTPDVELSTPDEEVWRQDDEGTGR